jgi:hypothetical protein
MIKPTDIAVSDDPIVQALIGTLGSAKLEFAVGLVIRYHHAHELKDWTAVSRKELASLIDRPDPDHIVSAWARNPFWRPDFFALADAGYIDGWTDDPEAKGMLTPKFFAALEAEHARRRKLGLPALENKDEQWIRKMADAEDSHPSFAVGGPAASSNEKPPPLTAEQRESLRQYCEKDAAHSMKRWMLRLLNEHAAQQVHITKLETEMGHAAYVLADAKLNPPGRIEELEQENKQLRRYQAYLQRLRPKDEWHEDDGPVLWWRLPIVEPPRVAHMLDYDFADIDEHVTHWSPLPRVDVDAARAEAKKEPG